MFSHDVDRSAMQSEPTAEWVSLDDNVTGIWTERDHVRSRGAIQGSPARIIAIHLRDFVKVGGLTSAVDVSHRGAARTQRCVRVPARALPGEILLRRQHRE